MGGDATGMGKERTVFMVWLRNLKERGCLKDLGANEMIIFKWSLK
jgi:hypothetical protein